MSDAVDTTAVDGPASEGAERADVIRVLGISGSLRADSWNGKLLQVVRSLAPAGIELVVFDGLREVEPFDEDLEDAAHPGIDALRAAVRSSHAVFVATPEYNSSIPGQLKNAFDWLSRADVRDGSPELPGSAMYGRPVAVVSASTGQFGAVWAADELRKSLKAQGARVVVDAQVAVGGAADAFAVADDGVSPHLVHDDARARLVALLEGLAAQARALEAAGVRLVSASGAPA